MGRHERFGRRLAEIRLAAGWTQEELAARLDMPAATVQNWEQGRTQPTWEGAVKAADALGISLEEFVAEPGSMVRPRRGRPGKAPAEEVLE